MSDWKPAACVENLHKRAAVLALIRQYFTEQQVLEVDAAVLSQCAVSDPFIDSLEVNFRSYPEAEAEICYLQTSPEYAMKRLLAAGIGSIYQMGKVFRNGEEGRFHNPEFTMLEWYRLGLDDKELMDDVERLVRLVLDIGPIRRCTYDAIFLEKLGVDLPKTSTAELAAVMRQHVEVDMGLEDRDAWLNLLMSHLIEPLLKGEPIFITEYPASQSALARIKENAKGESVAARFELFVGGMELANGYHELTDPEEQQRRLDADQHARQLLALPQRPLEQRLVAALTHGLPDCAGVALGVDRLVMLVLQASHIEEVIPFTFRHA
ncbi:MAG: EF-P lysine aminoacylase EpmA [Pseudomonadales bacterium]